MAENNAIISACGLYRYRLERGDFMRDLASTNELAGKTVAFFGVNPSTADASLDDATVRKWIGFCRRWGAERFIVGNVFAFRATDVKALTTAAEPIGEENWDHIAKIAADADVLIPCWGNRSKVPKGYRNRFERTLRHIRAQGKPVMAFGFTASGDPLHPLMLGYDTKLIDWKD